eukprot:UN03242
MNYLYYYKTFNLLNLLIFLINVHIGNSIGNNYS